MKKALVILGCLLLLAITVFPQSKTQAPTSQPPQPGVSGRFQIIMNSDNARDVYLLDTQQGRIWKRVVVNDVKDHPEIWVYRERIDNEQQRFEWASKQEFEKKTAQ